MEKYKFSESDLKKILDLARLAPSVHNTQPWKIRPDVTEMEILIDKRYKLGVGDPVGRQTILSLGIFSEAVVVAAESIGLTPTITFTGYKVKVSFKKSGRFRRNIAPLLETRATDRSVYKKIAITPNNKKSIQNAWKSSTARIWCIDEPEFIKKLAHLTSKGIRLALSNPEFRRELSKYLQRSSNRQRGIAVKSLYIPWPLAIVQPELLRLGINTGQEAKLEEKRWLSASAVILITTDGDLHQNWFAAGRAYLKASLAIESLGLSQATSAGAVEAATFHEDVEQMLNTSQRLQAVIRIGRGVKKRRYSPRIGVNELIT